MPHGQTGKKKKNIKLARFNKRGEGLKSIRKDKGRKEGVEKKFMTTT